MIRELQRSDFEQLDDEILQWYDTVPEEVKIPSLDMEMVPVPAGPSYDLHRLQIWTRLRLNQVRRCFVPYLLGSVANSNRFVSGFTPQFFTAPIALPTTPCLPRGWWTWPRTPFGTSLD